MTNSDRLQEIRERAEKATLGPWKKTGPWHPIEPKTRQLPDVYSNVQTTDGSIADCWPWTDHEANAEFIAASREDIDWLLQLVTDQQKEITRARRTVSTLVGGMCEHKENCQYPNCECGKSGDPGSAFGTPGIPD